MGWNDCVSQNLVFLTFSYDRVPIDIQHVVFACPGSMGTDTVHGHGNFSKNRTRTRWDTAIIIFNYMSDLM